MRQSFRPRKEEESKLQNVPIIINLVGERGRGLPKYIKKITELQMRKGRGDDGVGLAMPNGTRWLSKCFCKGEVSAE